MWIMQRTINWRYRLYRHSSLQEQTVCKLWNSYLHKAKINQKRAKKTAKIRFLTKCLYITFLGRVFNTPNPLFWAKMPKIPEIEIKRACGCKILINKKIITVLECKKDLNKFKFKRKNWECLSEHSRET